MRLLALSLSVCLSLACHASAVQAAAPGPAVTDPAKADEDFLLQGEYWGYTYKSGQLEYIGVQVIALGDGKFDAVEYRGGLPGSQWDRQNQAKYEGTRDGQSLSLLGLAGSMLLRHEGGALYDLKGKEISPLYRIERQSPTMGARPVAGAEVLFDGAASDSWNEALTGAKLTDDGHLSIGATTSKPYQDFFLHAEFRTPYMPQARGQGRGNSGFYLQQRYEVQVLDSFGLEGKNNECGGLYTQRSPDVNMCLPPLTWQTYDIQFTAARWDETGKKKVANARITVRHNGVLIHNDVELKSKTGAGKPETPDPRPIHFQNHGNPVVFRNMWILDAALASSQEMPVGPSALYGCVNGSCQLGTGACGSYQTECLNTYTRYCRPRCHRRRCR